MQASRCQGLAKLAAKFLGRVGTPVARTELSIHVALDHLTENAKRIDVVPLVGDAKPCKSFGKLAALRRIAGTACMDQQTIERGMRFALRGVLGDYGQGGLGYFTAHARSLPRTPGVARYARR